MKGVAASAPREWEARRESLLLLLVAAGGSGVLLGLMGVWADGAGSHSFLLNVLASTGLGWAVVAAVMGSCARRPGAAVLVSTVTLCAAVVAYYQAILALGTRPHSSEASVVHTAVEWTAAGLISGPLLGWSAWSIRRGSGPTRAATSGFLGGLLLSQGLYLLVRDGIEVFAGDTRSVLLGAALVAAPILVVLSLNRRHLVVAAAVTGVVGTVGALGWSLLYGRL